MHRFLLLCPSVEQGGREGGRGYVHAVAFHDDPLGHDVGGVSAGFRHLENDARSIVDGVECSRRREGGREGEKGGDRGRRRREGPLARKMRKGGREGGREGGRGRVGVPFITD